MTAHPIDTEALRKRALGQLGKPHMDPRWPGLVLALLDLIADTKARAEAAEHRATRAEKWAALWKETARHQLGRIADRDDAHASCHWNSLVQADEVSAWQERAEQAEARIKAVREVHWPDKALTGHICAEDSHDWPCPTIRALDGSVTPPDA